MSRFGMKIMLASAEAAPLAKVGGLGDVAGSLPAALAGLGCRASLALPGYRQVFKRLPRAELYLRGLKVNLGPMQMACDIYRARLSPEVPVYLVHQPDFFDRAGVYGGAEGEYPDNQERFMFFSRAVVALCRVLPAPPQAILANDWQTGLIMADLANGALPGVGGVFAVHNLGHHGLLPMDRAGMTGLPGYFRGPDGLEFWGNLSLLKAGIVYANRVVTVSPTYAREITSPEFGFGLDGLMRAVAHKTRGILNGIDTEAWDPAGDPRLAANYTAAAPGAKIECKRQLLKRMGLPEALLSRPLLGVVSRLVPQKGCKLILDAAPYIFQSGAAMVVLGSGNPDLEEEMSRLAVENPQAMAVKIGYDDDLAHLIMAGSDMFLVPSEYEPCGLTQMFALRYGSLPVVRATGGLMDTVVDPFEDQARANGFKFWGFNAGELAGAIKRALKAWGQPASWRAMVKRGMAADFSWRASATGYLEVCGQALQEAGGNR